MEILYSFITLEDLFKDTARFKEQYQMNNIEVETTMLIGNNSYSAIFVIK